jgi:hypothetical protein
VKLDGGLGNQMFQYAAGRRLALKHGVPLELDLSWLKTTERAGWGRSYQLDCFNIQARKRSNISISKIRRLFHKQITIQERDRRFNASVLDAPDDSYLIGYWQCETYFKDVEGAIRRDFTFSHLPEKRNKELMKKISNCNSVSLHFRRSDYVDVKGTNQFFGVPSLDKYYYPAVKFISERVSSPHFFVFSDDPAWGKQNLTIESPTTFVDHNPPQRGFEDLRLISNCKHHIIANSSFSWWGAWLNPNREKIVIAPSKWCQDPDQNKIILPDWITI